MGDWQTTPWEFYLDVRYMFSSASLSPLIRPLLPGFCISLGNFCWFLLVFLLLETVLGVYGFNTYGFTASTSTLPSTFL